LDIRYYITIPTVTFPSPATLLRRDPASRLPGVTNLDFPDDNTSRHMIRCQLRVGRYRHQSRDHARGTNHESRIDFRHVTLSTIRPYHGSALDTSHQTRFDLITIRTSTYSSIDTTESTEVTGTRIEVRNSLGRLPTQKTKRPQTGTRDKHEKVARKDKTQKQGTYTRHRRYASHRKPDENRQQRSPLRHTTSEQFAIDSYCRTGLTQTDWVM
jgi:hypothetical protein